MIDKLDTSLSDVDVAIVEDANAAVANSDAEAQYPPNVSAAFDQADAACG